MSRIEEAMEQAVRLRSGQEAPNVHVPETLPQQPPAQEARQHSPDDASAPATAIDIRNPYFVALNDPRSPIAEEYRKLKESLVRQLKGEGFQNMVMVTSALVGEGKTLTSINLALCLAQEIDHTVLLVDADLRRASCTRYLGLPDGPGLTECLTGQAELGDVLLRTNVGRLSILPAGSAADNPAELFASRSMQQLLAEIKSRYTDRYVIIDTPPVLPFAETRSISHCVDGVLMVVKEGQASPDNIQEALDSLRGGNVLGLVYNQAETVPVVDTIYDYHYAQRG